MLRGGHWGRTGYSVVAAINVNDIIKKYGSVRAKQMSIENPVFRHFFGIRIIIMRLICNKNLQKNQIRSREIFSFAHRFEMESSQSSFVSTSGCKR